MILKTNLATILPQMTTAEVLICFRSRWHWLPAQTESSCCLALSSPLFRTVLKLFLWINAALFYPPNFTELYNKISSSEGLCSVRNQFFFDWRQYSSEDLCTNPEEKKDCKENNEWRVHIVSDIENISLSLEPKQEKGLGSSPDLSIIEWVLSVGEDQHLAQAI